MDWWGRSADNAALAPNVITPSAWLMLPSLLHELADPTAMRLMIFWSAITTAAAAAGAVFGIGVIPFTYLSVANVGQDTLPAVGTVPGPISQPDADWLYWCALPTVPGAGVVLLDDYSGPEILCTSKAKRRLGNDKSLLVVVESKANTFSYHWHARALVKE